jgi:hypothetical protein
MEWSALDVVIDGGQLRGNSGVSKQVVINIRFLYTRTHNVDKN